MSLFKMSCGGSMILEAEYPMNQTLIIFVRQKNAFCKANAYHNQI